MNNEEKRLFDVAKRTILHPEIIGTVISKDPDNLFFTINIDCIEYKFALQKGKDEGWIIYCNAEVDINEFAKQGDDYFNSYCEDLSFHDFGAKAYNVFLELYKIVDGKRPSDGEVVVHKTKSKFDLDMDHILGGSE